MPFLGAGLLATRRAGPLFPGAQPDTVVADIDGRPVTVDELRRFLATLPEPMQEAQRKNPREFLRSYGFFTKLVSLAERNKLDQKSPYKEQLAAFRSNLLMNAQMGEVADKLTIKPQDQRSYYDAHLDQYSKAKVRVILISYTENPSEKHGLSASEARRKAEGIVKELRTGADFAALAKKYSEDASTAAHGGVLGTLGRKDDYQPAIKSAVFAMRPGQVSDPVALPNGFYILKVDEVVPQPYEQVKDEIYNHLQERAVQDWIDKARSGVTVKVEREDLLRPLP